MVRPFKASPNLAMASTAASDNDDHTNLSRALHSTCPQQREEEQKMKGRMEGMAEGEAHYRGREGST